MCWISKNTPKKSKAIRDIPVYKILMYDPKKDEYMSPIMNYVYEPGKETESILDLPRKSTINRFREINVRIIDRGLHSYRKTSLRIVNHGNYIAIHPQIPGTVWHMHTDWRYKALYKHQVLCFAHIPKGSFYYLNEWGEYVSDTLVIDKIVNIEKELKIT